MDFQKTNKSYIPEKWSNNPKGLNKKKSFGLACFRYNSYTRKLEIAMAKKRCSFWFIEFVLGHYKLNIKNLHYLFNRMTNEEKLEISLLDFSKLWYRVWLGDDKDKQSLYIHCKKKFEENFYDKLFINSIITQTRNCGPIWEISKGRKQNPQETDINCAIREATEEMNITPDMFVLMGIEPKLMTYSNMKVQYVNKYFVSFINDYKQGDKIFPKEPKEIIEVKWMTLEQLGMFDPTGKIAPFVKSIMVELKKKYKIGKYSQYF
jgi:hypothetical protein